MIILILLADQQCYSDKKVLITNGDVRFYQDFRLGSGRKLYIISSARIAQKILKGHELI